VATAETVSIPRPGMLATVRNRRGLVVSVEPSRPGPDGVFHAVSVEYLDADGPPEDTLIWEHEPRARLLEPTALPEPHREQPMVPDEFDALVRAARWMALAPYVDPDGREGPLERLPLASPFHGAIRVEDFQLVPLLKALRMPRVALLLADDVGLGKTVEAGLILAELLLRRRIRRVLVLCPAALRGQWQQEMRDKFALGFDLVDRPATHALQKRLGLDASPWRSLPRIITSHDYLKQHDVFEQFRAACRQSREDSPHLPWDLLIVDEVHNLMPAAIGEDSEASRMLRRLAPYFEHKLFLTATPHNGHRRAFTGLLETLDPVRFTRKSEPITPSERDRLEQVVVRRLKSEINARTDPPQFAARHLEALPLALSREEAELSAAFQEFRVRVRSLVAARGRREELAGAFAVEVLGKRLLSCPVAFAASWHRYREGLAAEEEATADEVRAAERAAREDTGDDRESESRAAHATRTVGAWLKPLAPSLGPEMERIDQALATLGLTAVDEPAHARPRHDGRWLQLTALVNGLLCEDGRFRDDERLIVFTEYKATLDYLAARLGREYPEQGRIHLLYGGMDHNEPEKREEITRAFNDPADPVRLLVATDAASEGLNLQETARHLLHFDVPWNPARLDQRNGRLDRYGQARDVFVHHFTSEDDADLKFLAHVAGKVHTIREDLGSMGEVFDRAVERRLIHGDAADAVTADLDRQLEAARGRAALPARESRVAPDREELECLRALERELDLDPETLRATLDVALGRDLGRPRLDGPDGRGRFRLLPPVPAAWQAIVDDTLRGAEGSAAAGALRRLLFDPRHWMRSIGTRSVFRPDPDAVLVHLGHPVLHHALRTFARARFPGDARGASATRWTVRRAQPPQGAEALVLLTVEELAVNELRETFHYWVRTLRFAVRGGRLGDPLPHAPARDLALPGARSTGAEEIRAARAVWESVEGDLKQLLRALRADLTSRLSAVLLRERESAVRDEQERFRSRQAELSALIQESTVQRLEREIAALRGERDQGVLFDADQRLADLERSIEAKEDEIRRRREHYEELREQLHRERERVLERILPGRHALRGEAQVFPVALEIRL